MAVRDDADIVIGKVVGHGKSVPRNLFRRNRTGRRPAVGGARVAAHAAQALPPGVPRRARPALPGGPAAAGGPRLRHARVLPRAARSPCWRTTPVTTGSCATGTSTRRGATSTRRRTSPSCARSSTSSTPTRSPARSATGCTRAGTAARCSTGSRRSTPTRTSRTGATSTRRCTRSRSSASPRASTPSCPFNLRQRSRLLRAGDFDAPRRAGRRGDGAAGARPGGRRADRAGRRRAAPRGRARAAALHARRRPDPVGRRGRDGGARVAARCSCCSSCARPRRSTGCPPRRRSGWCRREDGRERAVLDVTGTVTAATAAGGAPLGPGLWEVHVVVIVAGFRAAGRVARARGAEHLMLAVTPDGRVAERRPGWQRNLRRRMPRPVVRALREAQRTVRRRTGRTGRRSATPRGCEGFSRTCAVRSPPRRPARAPRRAPRRRLRAARRLRRRAARARAASLDGKVVRQRRRHDGRRRGEGRHLAHAPDPVHRRPGDGA